MRYRRRATYRYTMVMRELTSAAPAWPPERLRMLPHGRWQPDVDVYETAETVQAVVDLAGVDEDHVEVLLFEDAVVIEGRRHLPAAGAAIYHAAGIRQGLFQVDIPLPAPIDAVRVETSYERGLLRITLPKRA
jgi:HSP20 family protein